MSRLLSRAAVEEALKTLGPWSAEGSFLKRTVRLDRYLDGVEWIARIAAAAEAMQHHPDIEFGWGALVVRTTTHDAGGLTDLDLELAQAVNAIVDP